MAAVCLSANVEKQNQAPIQCGISPPSPAWGHSPQDKTTCSSIRLQHKNVFEHKTIAQEPAQVQLMAWPLALKQHNPSPAGI